MLEIERLYTGEGGRLYWQRNSEKLNAQRHMRTDSLHEMTRFRPGPWLELGCGWGHNLRKGDVGVDIDTRALTHLFPDRIPVIGLAYDLPMFMAQSFSLVLTVGLLMHMPACRLTHSHTGCPSWQGVLAEAARLSRGLIICGEYLSEEETDLLWDPQTGAFGSGPAGLCWSRSYTPPEGWRMETIGPLPAFGPEVSFFLCTREVDTVLCLPKEQQCQVSTAA